VRVFATAIPVALIIGPSVTNKAYVMPMAVLLLGFLTVIYTYKGGMKAVVWTELVQATVYISGGAAALFILGGLVTGGWGSIWSSASAAGKTQAIDFAFTLSNPHTVWAGLIGGAFLAMASHGTDQLIVQRLMSSRSLQGRPARDHRIGDRRVLPVLSLPDDRARAVGVLSGTRLPANRSDLPDVHSRAHAAGARGTDRRRHRRRDHEHALGGDQLARRRDDARHLSSRSRDARPTIRRRCARDGCSPWRGAPR
jgi:hypothetical protein